MVTSTSKYGSRGRPLGARCTTARPHSRPNNGRAERRAAARPGGRAGAEFGRFFEADFGRDPRGVTATASPGTSFLRRGRLAVGGGAGRAAPRHAEASAAAAAAGAALPRHGGT